MGNTYQLLVDTTVVPDRSNTTAQEILAGLVARGMLEATPSGNCLPALKYDPLTEFDPLTEYSSERTGDPALDSDDDNSSASSTSSASGVPVQHRRSVEDASVSPPPLKLITNTRRRIGYRPGRRMADLYKSSGETAFWEQEFCGVEFIDQSMFNPIALVNSGGEAACPECLATVSFKIPGFLPLVRQSAFHRMNGREDDRVQCPQCGCDSVVSEWKMVPPLAFGNLAIRFWNWPPFYMTQWSLSVPSVVREYSGHTIVESYGHT